MTQMKGCACCGVAVSENTAAAHGRRLGRKTHDCSRCMMCGDPIDGHPNSKRGLAIHHVDEDRWNNVAENLMPLHHGCHRTWHGTGLRRSNETRSKMSQSAKRRHVEHPHTDETRAKISEARSGSVSPLRGRRRPGLAAALIGVAHSDDRKASNRAAQSKMSKCPDCGGMFVPSWMTRHKNEGNCA